MVKFLFQNEALFIKPKNKGFVDLPHILKWHKCSIYIIKFIVLRCMYPIDFGDALTGTSHYCVDTTYSEGHYSFTKE